MIVRSKSFCILTCSFAQLSKKSVLLGHLFLFEEYSPRFHESEPSSAQLMMRDLLHESVIPTFLQDPATALQTHHFYGDLFVNDPVFYGWTSLTPVRVLAQIINHDTNIV